MKVFDSLVQDILRERWASSPVTATLDGMHESDHLLDTFSPGYLAQIAAQRQAFIKALMAIHDDHLDLSRRIDKRVLLGALNASINDLTVVRAWAKDPALYLQTGLYGIYVLLMRQFAPEEKRARSAIQRAEAFPRLLQEAKENIETCPRVFAETAKAMAGAAKAFFSGPYFEISQKYDPDRARQTADACLLALDDLSQHITSVWLPSADENFAIGREAFAAKLKFDHGLPFSPEQLLEIGENARRDAVAQLEALAEKIEPGTPWPELVERFKGEHPAAGELLDAYRAEMRRARDFVADRELVTLPPDERLEVVETPAFDRPTTPYAALMPPAPFEHDQRSFFYVTPVEEGGHDREAKLREHSTYSIPVTALHEAYPGHHLQLVVSNRGTSLVRKVYGTNVLTEGWALYCEEMMYENGFYPDSATRLFQLKDLLWRACRVILDVRLQTGAISYDAAVNYLATEAHLDREFARAEVSRYCANPTQPMSYLIGRREILRLRQELQTQIQGKFSLRQFHDELLAWGSIPIGYIREGLVSNPAFSKAA